jgi:membrane protease YdiL (CAAX protease family)
MVVLITVAYLVLVAPIWGRHAYRRLVSSRETDPTALPRFYRRSVGRKCAWLVPIVLVLAVAPGLGPAHLGLAWPSGPLVGLLTWVLMCSVAVLAATTVLWRRRVRSGRSVPGLRTVRALTPRTREERRWAEMWFVSAALSEELMMRGLLLAAGLSFGLPPLTVVFVTSAMFGLIHLYQGWRGVAGTALLGAMLSISVLLTGSLLFAVILHLLMAVRAILVFATVPVTNEQVHATALTR